METGARVRKGSARVNSKLAESRDFEKLAFTMIDDAYSLLHAVSRTLLGKKLPKADNPYVDYDGLLKGPPTYDVIRSELESGKMKTYQDRLYNSMEKLVEYLKVN